VPSHFEGLEGPPKRYQRLHSPSKLKGQKPAIDIRSPGQIDHDRILYTSAFRRLAGVTQVVGPLEGHVFHNRLTHTLEVAQVARRLAERLRVLYPDAVMANGGLDPDVAEAAGLAHDLGHPPFGHIAEAELDRLARHFGAHDGFEGNAQSFRILTRLAAHRRGYDGLNLTAATLNAVLKYPWFRGDGPAKKQKKFGAYRTEAESFRHARQGRRNQRQSLEAAVMDHADAIAYSVHDLDDFYRAGLIPLETIFPRISIEIEAFKTAGKVPATVIEKNRWAIERMWFYLGEIRTRYSASYPERVLLRAASSRLIDLFVSTVGLDSTGRAVSLLIVPDFVEVQMRFLQNLVWRYVITNPALGTQQEGQRRVINTLFTTYRDAIRAGRDGEILIPPGFKQEFDAIQGMPAKARYRGARETRLAVDIVASFTDQQAVALYRRMIGVAAGSVTDRLG